MKNIAVIYHDADFDGKLSNEVCRFHLKRLHPDAAIHSFGWDYGRPVPLPEIPALVEGEYHPDNPVKTGSELLEWRFWDQIYIVDLSVDELMARPELRDKIVWIDHHKTAIDKWDNSRVRNNDHSGEDTKMVGYRLDGVAACRLCWQWFAFEKGPHGDPRTHPVDSYLPSKQDFVDRRITEPELLRLAGEYDIWDHRDPDAKALQFGLRSLHYEKLAVLVHGQFEGCGDADLLLRDTVECGRAIKAYCDRQNDEYSAAYARMLDWEGLRFCCLNIGQRGNSDLARGGLKPGDQAIFAWRHTGDGVMVSLYHAPGHEDIDLSVIAKKYGGGGHRGACGFRISLKQLAEILL